MSVSVKLQSSNEHYSAPQLQGLKPALCLQSDRASVCLSSNPLVHWRLSVYVA